MLPRDFGIHPPYLADVSGEMREKWGRGGDNGDKHSVQQSSTLGCKDSESNLWCSWPRDIWPFDTLQQKVPPPPPINFSSIHLWWISPWFTGRLHFLLLSFIMWGGREKQVKVYLKREKTVTIPIFCMYKVGWTYIGYHKSENIAHCRI